MAQLSQSQQAALRLPSTIMPCTKQRWRRVVAFACCASTAALAPRRGSCEPAKSIASQRRDAAAALPASRRGFAAAAAAAAALPAAANAAPPPPAPEVAMSRKGAPIVRTAWEASHTAGAADMVAGLGGEPTLLLTNEDGALEPYALHAECTHLGCLVGPWNPVTNRFVCPCHGSEYRRDGSVARGPAPRPLKLAKVSYDEAGRVVLEKWTDADTRS